MGDIVTNHELSFSIESIFTEYNELKLKIIELAEAISSKDGGVLYYFKEANAKDSYFQIESLFDSERAIAKLSSDFWSRTITKTRITEYMPAKIKNDWDNAIRELTTPPFERDIVLETIKNHILSKDDYLAEKVDGIFFGLSKRHVTNSPFAFRDRFIIDNFHNFHSTFDLNCSLIEDLRIIIADYFNRGKPPISFQSSFNYLKNNDFFGEWHEFDGGTLRFKFFKCGTCHFEVHDTIACYLNKILAHKYPSVIASDSHSSAQRKKKQYKPLIDKTLSDGLLSIIQSFEYYEFNRELKFKLLPSREEKKELDSLLLQIGCYVENDSYKLDFEPKALFKTILRTGYIPDIKSYQFYPTSKELAKEMARSLMKWMDGWLYFNILEPSAGTGNLLEGLEYVFGKKPKVTAIDISDINCEILKSKGYKTINMDFLDYKKQENIDAILMNPPFSQGQTLDHIRHAFDLLDVGGILVACVPASMIGKDIFNGKAIFHYSKIFEDQFDNTNIKVSILSLKKIELN